MRTGEESTLIPEVDVRRAVGGGEYVYLWLFDEGQGVLMRVGPGRDVVEMARFEEFGCCWPWVADETTLYLKRREVIEAWPADGAPFTVANFGGRSVIARATVDDRYVYWADSADILYADKRGGPVETLVESDTSFVEDLTTDGCAVFWAAVNPPRVLVRSVP